MTQGAIDLVQAELMGMADVTGQEEYLMLQPLGQSRPSRRRHGGVLSGMLSSSRRRSLTRVQPADVVSAAAAGGVKQPSHQSDKGSYEALAHPCQDLMSTCEGQGVMDMQVLRRQARILLSVKSSTTRTLPTRLA
jgi:hypothetical protein